VLVPGLTMVLGEMTWKIPAWLDRILPHLNVEGTAVEMRPDDAPATPPPRPKPVTS
jgi:RND superfamily putative drug exporter